MSRLVRLPPALVALALIVACQGDRSLTPPSLFADLQDGANNGGNPDFFFFPPLVPNPTSHPNLDPGGFNHTLVPFVRVCELTADPAMDPSAQCVTGDPVLQPTPASLVPGEELYKLEWDTEASGLQAEKFYRIQVFGGGSPDQLGPELGFLDVDPVDNGVKNAKSTETYVFQDRRTVPIKFRIENGALCVGRADCGERIITDAGGDVITNTGFAAASFPPGALNAGQQVTVIIERVTVGPDNDCHDGQLTGVAQFEGCYDFRTEPGPTEFNFPVRVEVCVEVPFTDARLDFLSLFKSNGEITQALPNVDDELIDCANFSGGSDLTRAGPAARLLHLASAGWRALTRLVVPKPAYATTANLGLGGETGSFSNIGWGLVSTSTSLTTSAELGVVNEPLTLTATVTPSWPMTPTGVVQFFDGSTLLGSATLDAQGAASLAVNNLGLAPHTLSASFAGSHGTPHMLPSTSSPVAQHVIQRFDLASDFTVGLGDATPETEDFDGIAVGTPISTIIANVLDVASTFGTLEVRTCGIFGFDATTRLAGNGRYDLLFTSPRNAVGFDVAAQDPATDPAQIEVHTDAGTVTFPVENTSGNESIPTFLGMISTIALDSVIVHEGPEVGGSGNEEICLDNFIVANVTFP